MNAKCLNGIGTMLDAAMRISVGVAVVLGALPAIALELGAPFIDPLQTLPTVIEAGTILPGDNQPIQCPTNSAVISPLALDQAVDLALCNNPQLKNAWAGIKVQAGAVGEARAAYLPALSATMSRLETNTRYPDSNMPATTTRGKTISSTLAWRLFDFGGREANREAANNLLVAAIASHDAALQKTLINVIQAYFDAQTAKATLAAKGENEVLAKSTFDSAQRREMRGVVSRSDTLQSTTALAKASLEKNRALGDYRKALSVLVYVLGIDPQTQIIVADDLNDKETLDAKTLNAWLDIAQQSHPAILAAQARWKAAKQKITATRSEGLPTVDFSANYYQNGYPSQGISPTQSRVSTVGVSVSIPFFDGFSRTYKIRGAQAQAEQRAEELQDTEQNILMEVVKAHADAIASLSNLDASKKLLTAAQESLQTSQRKYEKGAADILEILNTQVALSDAQQERIRSLAEWRSARLRLLANVGLMGREAVQFR